MKYVKEIVPYVKIFLFAYLVIMILPIHHATGLNIQSYIQWAIFGCMKHNNIILDQGIGVGKKVSWLNKCNKTRALLPNVNKPNKNKHKCSN